MYEMKIKYRNEEVDVFNVDFGAHDLYQMVSHDTNALICYDVVGKEQVIYQDAIQKITFSDANDD